MYINSYHASERHRLYPGRGTPIALKLSKVGREQVASTNGIKMGTGKLYSIRNGLANEKGILVMEVCPFQLAIIQ